ncbi:MAG TPA: hypothetical protein PLQ49_04990 [Methanothrix sp.]|mgnify:FL=1|nr:hypothetical protein [Methanothrix sp.]HRW83575.1 hypothetical protein [Methanothrix sp.]
MTSRAEIYACAILVALLLAGLALGQLAEFDRATPGNETSEPVVVIGTSTEPQGLLPSVRMVQYRTETGWSNWISVKGVRLTTEPVAISPEDGIIDILSGGNENDLWHIRLQDLETWSDWTKVFGPPPYNKNLGGVHFRKYELAAVSTGTQDGDYHLFTWGPTNHCLHKRCWGCDGGVACDKTEDWTEMEGEIGSRPAAVLAYGEIHLFALDGSDGLVWNSAALPAAGSEEEPSWSGWESLEVTLSSPPAAAFDGELIHIFALRADGSVGHASMDPETGNISMETIDQEFDSAPATVVEDGIVHLFGVLDGELIHIEEDGDGWSDGENLKGSISGQPAAVSCGMGEIWVFAQGQGGWLWAIHCGPED